jgi:hypothetical protein
VTRTLFTVLLLVAGLLLGQQQAIAQPRDRPLRDVEVLSLDVLLLDLTSPAIRDLRPLEIYLEGHIPGSHPLDWKPLEAAVLSSPGPAMDRVVEALGDAQLRPGQMVALYDVSTSGRADGWVAWLLAYGGLHPVEVFDGGFAGWNIHRQLGVYSGHSIPHGRRSLRAKDLKPKPELRFDPALLEAGIPEGWELLVVDPPGDGEPPAGHLRAGEVVNDKGFFLYPFHLRLLLESRELEPHARFLIQGDRLEAGLVWTALVGNGFTAAMVVALSEDHIPKQVP